MEGATNYNFNSLGALGKLTRSSRNVWFREKALGKIFNVEKSAKAQKEIVDLSLSVWNELLGVVDEATEDYVLLKCTRIFRVRVPSGGLKPSKHLLRKGAKVGVLRLDDGNIKVRKLDDPCD